MTARLRLEISGIGLEYGALIACTVRGSDGSLREVALGVSEERDLDVSAGNYLISAVRPGLETITTVATVAENDDVLVALRPRDVTAASAQPDDRFAAVNPLLETYLLDLDPVSPARDWVEAPQGPRSRDFGPSFIRLWQGDEQAAWDPHHTEESPGEYLAVLRQDHIGPFSVQVGGDNIAWRVAMLAPSTRSFVRLRRTRGGRFNDGIAVDITSDDAPADAMLRYLAAGQLNEARTIGADLIALARQRTSDDSSSAADITCVAGFYSLRVDRLDAFQDMLGTLLYLFPRLPDASIIAAWTEVSRLPKPPRGQFVERGLPLSDEDASWRDRLLQAAAMGVPHYTEGLRLLYKGLRGLATRDPDDRRVADRLESVRRYAEACDWSSPLTTYWARRPSEPTLERITGMPDDPSGWSPLPPGETGSPSQRELALPGMSVR